MLFSHLAEAHTQIHWSYHPWLVVLSLVIASLAAASAFAVVERARVAGGRSWWKRVLWVAYGAVSMGFGVWGMHFTGMLAIKLPLSVSYDLNLTLLSLVPAIVGSGLALYTLSVKNIGHGRVQAAAVLLAAGIGTMHFTGMAAMRAAFIMTYVPSLFALSLVVAYVLAAIALYTKFALQRAGAKARSHGAWWRYSVAGAITAGLAVAGMHYMAMASTRFYDGPWITEKGVLVSSGWMALAVAGVATLIVALTLVSTYVDRRLSQASMSAMDADARQRAIVASMADGLVTFEDSGSIEAVNPAAERIFGRLSAELVGEPVNQILPELDRDALPLLDSAVRLAVDIGKEMQGRRADGRRMPLEVSIARMKIGDRVLYNAVLRDITSRKKTEMGLKRLATAVEQTSESVIVADAAGIVQYVNPAFLRATGFDFGDVLGKPMKSVASLMGQVAMAEEVEAALARGEVWSGRVMTRGKDGKLLEQDGTVSPVRDGAGGLTNSVAVFRDVTERANLERQLLHAQKLEAIGQLAAGIAHEINTPTQYVGDNTRFLMEAFEDLAPALRLVQELAAATGDARPALPDSARWVVEAADIPYHLEEIPRAINQSLEGVSRVANIVRAMKEFSFPGEDKRPFDLNRAIESTVTVATNEWKYVADVNLDLDPDLPLVPLMPGEFNQVVLNLIVNSAQAIGEAVEAGVGERGTITITSRMDGDWVEVRVRDTGPGIPEEIQTRIFEPFFTTKDVGKGTGQGLSLAHAVIVKKHGGSLTVDSSPGEGACFIIRLPLHDPDASPRVQAAADAASPTSDPARRPGPDPSKVRPAEPLPRAS